jgi:hypothetical protein
MPKIFISYRTADSEDIAGRIYDNLRNHYEPKYGQACVLIDKESMIPGRDFRQRLRELLQEADIVTAVIGTEWLGPMKSTGWWIWKKTTYRIWQDDDWVRFEIENALKRIPVLPVLVHGATMPSPTILPESLRQTFPYLQAQRVDGNPEFYQHIDNLIASIDRLTGPGKATA